MKLLGLLMFLATSCFAQTSWLWMVGSNYDGMNPTVVVTQYGPNVLVDVADTTALAVRVTIQVEVEGVGVVQSQTKRLVWQPWMSDAAQSFFFPLGMGKVDWVMVETIRGGDTLAQVVETPVVGRRY